MVPTDEMVREHLRKVKEALKEPNTYATFVGGTSLKPRDISVENFTVDFRGRVGKLDFRGQDDVFMIHVYKQLV